MEDNIIIVPGAGCCPMPEGWLERDHLLPQVTRGEQNVQAANENRDEMSLPLSHHLSAD